MPLEEVTLSILEDCKFQLDMIAFTADIDAMWIPSHKQLFHSIFYIDENLRETYDKRMALSKELGIYGFAIQYLAKELITF